MAPASSGLIALAAGESSGDLLASLVLPQLRQHRPYAQMAGIGGDYMIAAGFDAWWHVRELSVRGYAEVVRHLPRLLWLRARLVQRVLATPAQVFVGVDAPDFNLGVETRVRAQKIPTVHFVSPSIWAWRPQRIEKIRAAVDHMLLVFPFEAALYQKAGIKATYVGHPLASAIARVPDAAAARARLQLPAAATVVAVLPGSRAPEIEMLGPEFCAAIVLLQQHDRALHCVVPAADATLQARLRTLLDTAGVDDARTLLTLGRSHDALEAADVVLVAGGTATLEAMLFLRPMVIAYRVPRLTEWLTLRQAIIPYFGLPNILAGGFIVPEFLQEAVRAPALALAVLHFLDAPATVLQLSERFAALAESMRRDTAALAAQAICDATR